MTEERVESDAEICQEIPILKSYTLGGIEKLTYNGCLMRHCSSARLY